MIKPKWSRPDKFGILLLLCLYLFFISAIIIRILFIHPYKEYNEDLRFILLYVFIIGIFTTLFIWSYNDFNKRKNCEGARFLIGYREMKKLVELILDEIKIDYELIKRNRLFSLYPFSFRLSDLVINIKLSGSNYESYLYIGPITENNKVIIKEIQNKIDNNASSRKAV